jgi:hypothetical protein
MTDQDDEARRVLTELLDWAAIDWGYEALPADIGVSPPTMRKRCRACGEVGTLSSQSWARVSHLEGCVLSRAERLASRSESGSTG